MLKLDEEFNEKIIGVDEAGRGPLAGPVIAACAYIEKIEEDFKLLNDSKKLSEKKREKLYNILINSKNVKYGIGVVDSDIIDEINILNATFLAMRKALEDINLNLDDFLVLVDGNKEIKEYDKKQKAIIKGDASSLSIAAASIIAKVTRDRLMLDYSKKYPEYNFHKHKGYGTRMHYLKIKENGICKIHRKTFLKGVVKDER